MKHAFPKDILIPLTSPNHLFTVVEHDYFAEEGVYESGMDYLVEQLRTQRLKRFHAVRFTLPVNLFTPDLEQRIPRAIQQYCRHVIMQHKREFAAQLGVGLKALQVGVLLLVGCLSLVAFLSSSPMDQFSWSGYAREGLTIIAWVSLWRPIEIMLYEWWPTWRAVRVYAYIMQMPLAVAPAREND